MCIKSMTGYGKSDYCDDSIAITVEIKTINAKFLDINCKIPAFLQEKEIALKNLIQKHLTRGKIYINIDFEIKNTVSLRKW